MISQIPKNRSLRPCLICGRPTGAARCPDHLTVAGALRASAKRALYGGDYRRRRREVLERESVCWICGLAPRPDDPLECDHVPVPDGRGGLTLVLHAAHATCNRSRGGREGNRRKRILGET